MHLLGKKGKRIFHLSIGILLLNFILRISKIRKCHVKKIRENIDLCFQSQNDDGFTAGHRGPHVRHEGIKHCLL